MGSEFGQFIEWNYKQGLDWLLLDYPMHKAMQRWCGALNACYRSSRALWDIDDGWDGFTWLNVDDAERSAIAFLRTARNGRRVVCVCNFTPVRYDDFVIGLPKRGVLRELLSSDSGGLRRLRRTQRARDPQRGHALRRAPLLCTRDAAAAFDRILHLHKPVKEGTP
ncbi:MAG: alpha amylase C-terminal domain-containing protein [Oscillospiraceae bacterium]